MSTITPRQDDDADHRYRYLDERGHPIADVPAVDPETLFELYESLRFARAFDERAQSLQRQGRIATYAPMAGQAGAQVAAALAMDEADWLYPTYRDNAAKFARGVDPADVLALLAGHEGGGDREARVLPEYIPIATQLPQAVGAAWAGKLRGDDDPEYAVLATLGDGATSEGDFHEGLNFAGVFDVPAVFLCQNNGWAISTPTEQQTRSETLARKAGAYGVEGVRVDGMDPLATYVTVRRAIRKAKGAIDSVAGDCADPEAVAAAGRAARPTMVEAVVKRFGPHTTSDDPSRYREKPDRAGDPLPRFETFLRGRDLLDDERVAAVGARVEDRLADVVERAEARETDPDAAFENVYAEQTPALEDQQAELQRLREEYGDRLTGGL